MFFDFTFRLVLMCAIIHSVIKAFRRFVEFKWNWLWGHLWKLKSAEETIEFEYELNDWPLRRRFGKHWKRPFLLFIEQHLRQHL